MTNRQRSTANNLQRLMLSGAVESVSLAQEVGKESIADFDGISLGDENLLERVGVFVSRNYGEYRFNQLRRKVASYIGKRKALIEIGNRHLRVRGVETVVIRADYGLSDCKADSDTSHTNGLGRSHERPLRADAGQHRGGGSRRVQMPGLVGRTAGMTLGESHYLAHVAQGFNSHTTQGEST